MTRSVSVNPPQFLLLEDSSLTRKISDVVQMNLRKDLLDYLKRLEEPLDRIGLDTKYMRDNLDANQRKDILNWISSLEYEKHHLEIFNKMLTGTGAWLLRHKRFQDWRNSKASSMFWLHGIGKYSRLSSP